MKQERRRAGSIAELHELMGRMWGGPMPEAEPYRPRPTDVIITPFGKCGTTWLQQIFHTLRTRGDTDYDDISRVVPWIEVSPRLGIDLNAEQKADPRGYKSHLSWDQVPKGARYIVSIRDPRDALVSAYHFMVGWWLEPGAVSIDEFARSRFIGADSRHYWRHLTSWWPHRHDDDVLLLAYERMLENPEDAIRRIAGFSGIVVDDELLAITLEHSSMDFMLRHKNQFDDRLMRELSERVAGLPAGSDSAKVRQGRAGGHRAELGAEVLAEMDAVWREEVTSRYGYASYQEMVDALELMHA